MMTQIELHSLSRIILKVFCGEKGRNPSRTGNPGTAVLVTASPLLTYTGPVGREFEASGTLAAVAARAVDAVCVALAEVVAVAALVDVWKGKGNGVQVNKSFHYSSGIRFSPPTSTLNS